MIHLHHGDCRELLASMPHGSVDAIVTDPPYGMKVDRDGYGRRQIYHGSQHIEGDESVGVMAEALAVAFPLLKPDSWAAVFCSPKRRKESQAACEDAGFVTVGEIVWDKARPGLGGGIRYQHETILLLGKGKPSGLSSLFSVIREAARREGSRDGHPHEKPVRLMRQIIGYCTRDSETILDPFMGTCASGVACIRSNRSFIGCEIDEQWHRIAVARISAEQSRHPLFEQQTPILSRMFADYG